MGASRSRGHVTGGKPRQALKRPFLAALRYRYLPPCSTAGRPCTGRAPVLLWSATPCWLWFAGCGLQRLSSCCKTSTTVWGYGTHIRIFLCVSVCVVSLISALPRRRVHAVHASRIGHHVRVTCCAYIISVEVVLTPACIALMIGASARGSRLNSTCTPQEHQCLYYLETSTPRLPLGVHKTRSRSAQVHARTDHSTKPPAVLADEPSCSCVFRYSPCVDNTEDNRTS